MSSYQRLEDVDDYQQYTKTDTFYIYTYLYHLHKGYNNLVLMHIYDILRICFMLGFYIFLVGYVDIHRKGVTDFREMIHYQGFGFISGVCIFIFSLYLLISLLKVYHAIKNITSVKNFYRNVLKINDADLHVLDWNDVSIKFVNLPRFNINSEFDQLIFANRIMRKENYIIGMMNMGIFKTNTPLTNGCLIGTKGLEWSMFFILFHFFFDDKGMIKKNLVSKQNKFNSLRIFEAWITRVAILSFVLAPIVWIYLIVYAVLRYSQELKTQPHVLSSRKWNNASLWAFREYNELFHTFRARINKSFIPSKLYIDHFENHVISNTARFLLFVFGSFATILLFLSLLQIETFWGKNVIWWIGILGVLIAVCRTYIPDPNVIHNPKKYMEMVVEHTHYKPTGWQHKEHTTEVQHAMCQLYEYKSTIFLRELCTILMIPFVVWFDIRYKAERILDFFINNTIETDIGHICKFAAFNIEECGNPAFCGNIVNNEYSKEGEWFSRDGKMEKSIINFKVEHKDWLSSSPSTSKLLSNIDNVCQGQDNENVEQLFRSVYAWTDFSNSNQSGNSSGIEDYNTIASNGTVDTVETLEYEGVSELKNSASVESNINKAEGTLSDIIRQMHNS